LSPVILKRTGSGAAIRAAATKEIAMTEPLVVRRETHIAAPPATVFAFLTDPEKILSWMGSEVKTETHPGGLYLVKGISSRVARGAFLASQASRRRRLPLSGSAARVAGTIYHEALFITEDLRRGS